MNVVESLLLLSRSAFFSLNGAPWLWLTAWLCSCWQLRLPPQDNISPPHLSLHLSNHPSLPHFLLPTLSSLSSPLASYCSSPFSSSPALFLFQHFQAFFVHILLFPPVATPTIRFHLSLCTSAIRVSWQPNASHVPKPHTQPQRLCPDKTAREQIKP